MKQLLTLAFLLLALIGYAQAPSNDDCPGIIDLGEAPFCPEGVFYSNVGATPSDVFPGTEAPTDCNAVGEPQTDVWFQFNAVTEIEDYTITLTGLDNPDTGEPAILQPVIIVYRGEGPCVDMEQLQCEAAPIGSNDVQLVFDAPLTPGAEYYLRIFDRSVTGSNNPGSFQLCVEETVVPPNLCEDIYTTDCSGEIFDCGGPDGDYESGSNYTLTIEPEGAACVTLSLVYYNLDPFGDNITFYNGPSTSSPIISAVNGAGFPDGPNSGGACYQVSANSGALTMQFTSDGFTEFEGFQAIWECSEEACDSDQIISATDVVTEQDIVDVVSTPQSLVTITNIDCPEGAYGLFTNGDETDLGLEQGLVLTSGQVLNNPDLFQNGINNPGTVFASTSNQAPGDADLDYLSDLEGGQESNDACIIEFDVFANTNELTFEYVFGSEEYPEFVGSGFNDIFAFFISGEGIEGDPDNDNKLNIATLPDGTPVQINSVNDIENWEYYRNNLEGPSVVYDGLTSDFQGVKKSLTASADVVPCNTYNLKMAIADRGDFSYDSGVFISEIRGGSPTVSVDYQNGIQYLVEECTTVPDLVVINIGEPLEQDQTFEVLIGGSAIQGVDYDLTIPPTITFPAGDTVATFPITVENDGIPEDTENILITLRANYGCGDIVLSELEIELQDALNIEVESGVDTVFVCTGSCVEISVEGAADYIWSPADLFDPPNTDMTTTCPTASTQAFVVGLLGVCSAIDTFQIEVVDPALTLGSDDVLEICEGTSVQLFPNNNVGNANLMFTPDDGSLEIDPVTGVATATPLVTTTYTASVEVAGCVASDEITVTVDPFDFPEVIADTVLCQNSSTQLATMIENSTTQFVWTPDMMLEPSNMVSGPIATPDVTTTYTLTATSQNNFCSQQESVTITVVPADVDILNDLPVEICLGESVDITAASTHPDMVTWTPVESLSPVVGVNVTANPTETTTYFASLEVDGCIVGDTVTVRVDSLPPSGLVELIPMDDPYCQGETVTFVFPVYDPADYEDIMHQWTPTDDLQTPDTLWNLVISAQETTTFTRVTTNHACSVTEEVQINVVIPEDLMLTVTPETVCPGDTVQFQLTSEADLGPITWNTDLDLSCDDCPNPTAVLQAGPVTVSATSETEEGSCPLQSNQVTIEVLNAPSLNIEVSETDICLGTTISLDANNNSQTITWTDQDGNVLSTETEFTDTPTQTTTYTATASNDGGQCGDAVQSVTVAVTTEEPTITLEVSDDLLCEGESVTITAVTNSGSPNPMILWTPDNLTGVSPTDTPAATTTYTATYTDGCGFEATDMITVEVAPDFNIDSLIADPVLVFEGEDVTLTVFTTPANLDSPMYEWTQQGAVVSNQGPEITVMSPEFTGPESDTLQTIPVEVTITDAAGCMHTFPGSYNILRADFDIPNVFTPNGDGMNDTFSPIATGTNVVTEFRIFNRWGQVVYENETPETGWNGMYKEKFAPADVYAYVVKYTDPTGAEVVVKGDVTLVR